VKYVYVHRRKTDNTIFYIGKGSGKRYKETYGRNKDWCRIVEESRGFIAEIVLDLMTDEEALTFESELILFYKDSICNKREEARVKNYNLYEFNKKFKYDPTSPSGLALLNGENTGYKSNGGYWIVNFESVQFVAHRVIWCLLKGPILGTFVINHIDCNKLNNNIDNLEMVDTKTNNRKTKRIYGELQCTNTSGYTNIMYEVFRGKTHIRARAYDPSFKLFQKILVFNPENHNTQLKLALEWQKCVQEGLPFNEVSPIKLCSDNGLSIIKEYSRNKMRKSGKVNKEHYLKILFEKEKTRRSKQISLLDNDRDYCVNILLEEYDKWVADGFVPARETLIYDQS